MPRLTELLPGSALRALGCEPVLLPGAFPRRLVQLCDFAGGPVLLVFLGVPDGAPRHVRQAAYELESIVRQLRDARVVDAAQPVLPMLLAPYLSPAARAVCVEHGVGYLDVAGNARLRCPGVYIDISSPERPRGETRRLRSVFAPQAAAILHVLLRDPQRCWLVADLAAVAGVSLGHASNVRRALLDREWLSTVADGRGVVLSAPAALLRAWRECYQRPAERLEGYTTLLGAARAQRLAAVLNAAPGRPRAVYAEHSAADWLAPYLLDAGVVFHADRAGAQALQEALELQRVELGPNVLIHVTDHAAVFANAVVPAPGVVCTGPVSTYLDLWVGHDRERESAQELARRCLPWMSAE